MAFNEIAQKALPAVVSISVIRTPTLAEQLPIGPFGGAIPFGPFGGQGPGEMMPEDRSVGLGSGVIVRPDGHILTNHHVIENAERITVTLDEKHKFKARVVGSDAKTDLAILKIDAPDGRLPVLKFGDSSGLRVGDWAVAIGSPFGLSRSVSSGIISATGRAQMGILEIEDFIQTDAAINPGSSGGPLLNLKGEVVGVNTAIFSEGSGFVGIGFAIPSKIAREISDQLITQGKVPRGWIGMTAQDLSPALARHFRSPGESGGALVSDVQRNSPAQKASLRPGDVILSFNGKKVADATDLKKLVASSRAGARVPLVIVRDGKRERLALEIREQPPERSAHAAKVFQKAGKKGDSSPSYGLAVEDIPEEIAPLLQVQPESGALVVEVEPGSPAFDAGMVPGDVILKAGNRSVRGAKDFVEASKREDGEKGVVLYVQRSPQERMYLPLEPDQA